jgi:hypothetical protein
MLDPDPDEMNADPQPCPNLLWNFDNFVILNPKIYRYTLLKYTDLRLPDGGVDALEDGDGEGGGLARAGLRLGDHVPPLIQLHLAQMLIPVCR